MRSPPGRVRPAGTADTVNLREHQLPPSPPQSTRRPADYRQLRRQHLALLVTLAAWWFPRATDEHHAPSETPIVVVVVIPERLMQPPCSKPDLTLPAPIDRLLTPEAAQQKPQLLMDYSPRHPDLPPRALSTRPGKPCYSPLSMISTASVTEVTVACGDSEPEGGRSTLGLEAGKASSVSHTVRRPA